jgi:diguanylate cyclase (GGDEF)-like protein
VGVNQVRQSANLEHAWNEHVDPGHVNQVLWSNSEPRHDGNPTGSVRRATDVEAVLGVGSQQWALHLFATLVAWLVPAFWLLDWITLPSRVWLSLGLRAAVALHALIIIAGRHSPLVINNPRIQGVLLTVHVGGMISALCWMSGGLESRYYAGLGLVMLATTVFQWSRTQECAVTGGLYLCYVGPSAVALPHLSQVAISNHAFLISTMFLSFMAQRYRRAVDLRAAAMAARLLSLTESLTSAAFEDALTGLGNRRRFQAVLDAESAAASASPRPTSVVLLDVDHFKDINDSFGHPIGDLVLQHVARSISRCLRSSDHAARLGGDEFAMILPNTTLAQAGLVGERILATVSVPFMIGEIQVRSRVSIGVASAPPWTVDGLVTAADAALYGAKRRGRNQVNSVCPEPTEAGATLAEVTSSAWPASRKQ